MKQIAWHFMAFVAAGVFWMNLTRLVPTNPHYVPGWEKMAFAAFLFIWFTTLAKEPKP